MATTDAEQSTALFVDTCVLVYANVAEAPLHQAALSAGLHQAHDNGRTLWISRQVLREFAAVRSRPQTFTRSSDPALIVERLATFEKEFEVADDTAVVTGQLRRLMGEVALGGKQVHDANIVATMLANGIPTLLTHNVSDFTRFGTLIRVEGLQPQVG